MVNETLKGHGGSPKKKKLNVIQYWLQFKVNAVQVYILTSCGIADFWLKLEESEVLCP